MNELKQVAHDLRTCLDIALHALNGLSEAMYELRANLSFYADGNDDGCNESARAGAEDRPREAAPADEQGGARAPVQEAMDNGCDERTEGVQCEEAARPAVIIAAKPEHRRVGSRKFAPTADTSVARAVLDGHDAMLLTEYYAKFEEACASMGFAHVNMKGKRYLAHCLGYRTRTLRKNSAERVYLVKE